eukprot:c28571_g2_i1 orf=264-2219(+)
MALAMLVGYDDHRQHGAAGQVSFVARAQQAKAGVSVDCVWSEGMVELGGFRERNSVIMKAGGGKVFASPAYEPASDDSSSRNRKSMSLNAGVREDPWRIQQCSRKGFESNPVAASPPVAEMNKEERRELRSRLKQELGQIRSLLRKIELREQQLKSQSYSVGARPSLSDAQFSGNDVRNCVGREVTSELDITTVGSSFPFQRDVGLARQHSFSSLDPNHAGADASFKEKRTPKANQLYRKSEFLTGKDKMPPSEKSKSKSGAGGKRAALTRIDSRDSKRLSTDSRFQSRQTFDVTRQCLNLLKMLMNHKYGWVFNEPVDAVKLGLSDYHLVIKKPMDLGTIKEKLSRKDYFSPAEFANDVRLTFSNAMTYNPPGNDVHIMAASLLKLFEEKWKVIENKCEQERIKNEGGLGILENQPESSQVQPPHPSYLSQTYYRGEDSVQSQARPEGSSGKKKVARAKPKPKPKSLLPKREMTFAEKKRLSGNLQLLPGDKLEYIVELMKERNPNLSQKDDEIEVDIDTFDNDTLWELHRYVTNCMKSMSKNKKKAGEDQSDQNLSTPKNQVVADSGDQALARVRKGEIGDEDVDIDDDLPKTSFPPVEIDKDACYASRSSSSGSSSSESGSSSDSDSDSGSSSGSDSDAEGAQSAGRR